MDNTEIGKCESSGCKQDATVEVFWPGQPLRMCSICALKAQSVGKVMGVEVPVRRLPNVPQS